ncbi:archaeosortase/exosortase family protein [Marinoscillum luteum]|uniref:Archaeosortase/exosortase family protein n=1 Tax=Marinoscillum luteum TaxID=861051 RepID=A0ABW7NDW2_9BACT
MKVLGRELSRGYLFIIKAIGLIIIWKIAYLQVIAPYTPINRWLTQMVGVSTAGFFDWFGQKSYFDGQFLFINDIQSVLVADGCNGLELFALFLGFLIISPGSFLGKFLYSLGGVLLIFLANIIRVYLLGFNYLNNPSTFEFNHKYTYLGFVYLIIFTLWILWIEVINKRKFIEA